MQRGRQGQGGLCEFIQSLRAYSHQAKAKKMKEQAKEIKQKKFKHQRIFCFTFAFAWREWALRAFRSESHSDLPILYIVTVMFSQVCVKNSVHGGEVYRPLGQTPHRTDTPRANTPPGRHPPGQTLPGQTSPRWADTPTPRILLECILVIK